MDNNVITTAIKVSFVAMDITCLAPDVTYMAPDARSTIEFHASVPDVTYMTNRLWVLSI